MRIVDNAAARAVLVPQYVPELIVQRDTLVLYISTGINAGNWILVSDGSTAPAAFASITGDPYDNPNLTTALNAKQDALGFTPENVANKDTDSTFAANSDTKYPSQKAVKTALATKPTAALDTDGTLAANSDARVASQKATKTYVDQIIAAQDAMVFKGLIDCSANPNYPAADCGHTYRVSVVGKIGGVSGISVEIGDVLICLFDGTPSGNQGTVGADWGIIETNIDGEVIGPVSSTDGNIPQWDGTSGKLLKNGLGFDTDGALAANSDLKVASQKAVKSYSDASHPLNATAPIVLASTIIDLQTVTDTTVYTVPAGKRLVICNFMNHSFTGTCIKAEVAFLLAGQPVTGTIKYSYFNPDADTLIDWSRFDNYQLGFDIINYPVRLGDAGDVLVFQVSAAEPSAINCRVDLIGYLLDKTNDNEPVSNVRG